MIGATVSGNSDRTIKALSKMQKRNLFSDLHKYGEMGVQALAKATPVDSSFTANCWEYRITQERNGPRIEWYNTNKVGNTSVAILIQYGHGTGTGGYVMGRDYVNPAIQPLFDKMADDLWKKVKS